MAVIITSCDLKNKVYQLWWQFATGNKETALNLIIPPRINQKYYYRF